MKEWRVIEDGPKDGVLNMAIDSAILASCESSEIPPTLRLYSWKQPTLTVGYAQDIDKGIDFERCQELGIKVVRRPTGGRALLHHHEVTYSITAPVPHPKFPSSLQGSYKVVAQALLKALEELGVKTRVGRTGPRVPNSVGFSVIRAGNIVGDHSVFFVSPDERIELIHRATNRRTFARGALRAATWVYDKKPGFYSMRDVLDLQET